MDWEEGRHNRWVRLALVSNFLFFAQDFDFLVSGGLIKGMLSGLLFGPKAAWACFKVDASKVEAAKAASVRGAANLGAKGVEFVSTNDVLTSHFCRATQARLCMMVVNFRDKTDLDISDKNAGARQNQRVPKRFS